MAVNLLSVFSSERFSLQPIKPTVSGFVEKTFEGIGDKSFRAYQGTRIYFSGANIFLKANGRGIRPIDDANTMREILALDCGAQGYVDDALKMAILNHNSDVIYLLISEYHASADKALETAILNKDYDLTLELLDKYPASVAVTNIPDSYGVTLIHGLVRDGALNVIELIMKSLKESEVVLNPDAYFTLETLRSCTVPSEISEVDSIHLEQLAQPFYVGQNNCNTILIWEDGTQMVFRNTDAGIVFDRLYARLRQINPSLPPTADHEQLTFFGSPGHFFLGTKEGVVGFYPTEALTSDVARVTTSMSETTIPACIWAGRFYNHYGILQNDTEYERISDQKNHPKITIHIRKKDAQAVARRIEALRHACKVRSKEDCIYNTATNNCIVRAKELCGEIPCARFITDEQLAVGGFKISNIAHVYERVSRIVESEPIQNTVTTIESIALALVIAKITKSSVSWLYSYCRRY